MIEESAIRRALRQVMDPELGCNILDLGLVYGIAIKGARVTVTMTLTSFGSPLHESVASAVHSALRRIEGFEEVDVQVVRDPPWTPARMTQRARMETGIYAD